MESAWFETFFRGPALDFWQRVMTPEWTRAEVDFIAAHLHAAPGGRLLDMPCGTGRHAVALAGLEFRVTGVDLSNDFLAEARKAAPGGDWRVGDMRAPDLEPAAYDGAYCWGNSFGYLDYDGARQYLQAVAAALKPEATLLMDVPTVAESILPELENTQWHRTGDLIVLSETAYVPEESRLDVYYTFVRGGEIETRCASSYVMTIAELSRMLDGAGFDVAGLYRSTDGEPYELGAPGLIAEARRR